MRSGILISIWLLLAALDPLPAADPAREIASFSIFKNLSLNDLASGEILAERGPAGSFDRGLSIQSCYLVRKPVDQVAHLLAFWNPSNHKELEIYSSTVFDGASEDPQLGELRFDPAFEPVRKLLEETKHGVEDKPALYLASSELELLRKVIPGRIGDLDATAPEFRQAAEQFWTSLLKDRWSSFKSGGITALPPYDVEDTSVPIHGEILALLGEDPSVKARFQGLLDDAILQKSPQRAQPTSYYWQVLNSEKTASCCLGVIYNRRFPDKWQSIDYQIFSSREYLTMITLYEAWPVKSGNEEATLIWRSDFVSAPNFASLRGVEQMAATALMIKSIKNNIRFFQQDALHMSALAESTEAAPPRAETP